LKPEFPFLFRLKKVRVSTMQGFRGKYKLSEAKSGDFPLNSEAVPTLPGRETRGYLCLKRNESSGRMNFYLFSVGMSTKKRIKKHYLCR
jgi:hypothetical protein